MRWGISFLVFKIMEKLFGPLLAAILHGRGYTFLSGGDFRSPSAFLPISNIGLGFFLFLGRSGDYMLDLSDHANGSSYRNHFCSFFKAEGEFMSYSKIGG